MLFLFGSANRDDRRFPDGDSFDIRRNDGRHLTFGNGIHLCMGSALARHGGLHRPRRSARHDFPNGRSTLPTLACHRRLPSGVGRLFLYFSRRPSDTMPVSSEPEVRKYDSPMRRQRAVETRERIVTAGCRILQSSSVRDWRALTIRCVAERAGVNERTVYRYFGNERGLRDAVMHRLEQTGRHRPRGHAAGGRIRHGSPDLFPCLLVSTSAKAIARSHLG